MCMNDFFREVFILAKYFLKRFSKDELIERLALIYFAIISEGIRYEFKEQGLKCVILRGPMLQWNGFVGIPESHPLYGYNYFQKRKKEGAPEELLEVYGGITYSADSLPDFLPDGLWYFGFDCGHAHDYLPLILLTDRDLTDYKTRAFVESETRRLARRLKELAEEEIESEKTKDGCKAKSRRTRSLPTSFFSKAMMAQKSAS